MGIKDDAEWGFVVKYRSNATSCDEFHGGRGSAAKDGH